MKFFFNVCNSKFDEINMFFQKNKKFDSNERKFQNDVQINSIANSSSIEFRNLIEQKKNSKFYFRFVLFVNDESNSKNILTISNEFFQFEYEFSLIYFKFRYFVIFFFRNCFSMSVLKKRTIIESKSTNLKKNFVINAQLTRFRFRNRLSFCVRLIFFSIFLKR